MTVQEVKLVVDMKSVRTNTLKTDVRDSTTMTFPSRRTMDTQTSEKITVNKGIATDYAGQRNKHTSTPSVTTIESGTCMPALLQESKVTWTDLVQTTERSVCTEGGETTDSATETMQPVLIDQGVGVSPETRTVDTNTEGDALFPEAASAISTKEKKVKKEKDKTLEKKKKEKEKKEKKDKKKKLVDCACGTDPVVSNEKETNTVMVPSKEQWTSTVAPQLVNTGISPARPATREAGVATNPVTLMDQGTHTNVVSMKDNQTETVIMVCDGETLTERVDSQDAQTSVDVFSQSVEVSTEPCSVTDTGCSTDDAWLDEIREERGTNSESTICNVCKGTAVEKVDISTSPVPIDTSDQGTMVLSCVRFSNLTDTETQTPNIVVYDKSIATSCEFDADPEIFRPVDNRDASTSTESLQYIGLFSDMDCDELILVPEIAIDMVGSEIEYEKITGDSYGVLMIEAEAQTIVSAADFNMPTFFVAEETEEGPDMVKPIRSNLVNVAVNTEHKLTFEKETSMQPAHNFSRGTMTIYMAKTDKATSTGIHVRAIQEKLGQTPTSPKQKRHLKKDASVATDSYLLDERMVACINKLKNVSEKLQSPTLKTSSETPPWNKKPDTCDNSNSESLLKELEKCSESDRRKNVMDLAAKSQAMLKNKDQKGEPGRRKAQPITTLKGKYPEKDHDTEDQKKGHVRQLSADQSAVKLGSQSSPQKRTPASKRNNSAPGRIPTVPAQSPLPPKRSPKTSPKASYPSPKSSSSRTSDNFSTLPTQKTDHLSPDFYSTVPKTRHSKQGLPIISESRTPSTCSDSSPVSARARTPSSTSSSDALDLSSLKIRSPPAASSPSPQPVRRKEAKPKSPPAISTTIEVIPTIDIVPETRVRVGSSSSDLEHEPQQEKKGFMKKLFGSKKKKGTGEKRPRSPSKSPKPPRKAEEQRTALPPEPVKEKVQKPKPFVYMRSRIFNIQQDDEEKFNKPTVSKYSVSRPEDVEQSPLFDFAATFSKK